MASDSGSRRRVVSLVPSLTEALAEFGVADRLVATTRFCTVGSPDGARRIGGTKDPDRATIVALRPDLVLANAEENRSEDIEALRAAGLEVLVTFPRTVADVAGMLAEVAAVVGVPGAASAVTARVEQAASSARRLRPQPPVRVLTLVWRKPWMAAARGTYLSDLLESCGFTNVVPAGDQRYPQLRGEDIDRNALDVVLLPSEPYAFGRDDLPALHDLLGDVSHRFVDGRLLTWHGPSTAEALDHYVALARELADHPRPG